MPLLNPLEYRRRLPLDPGLARRLSLAPTNPQIVPEEEPGSPLREEYLRLLEPPRMPRLRPELGAGAFEDVEGRVQAQGKLAQVLGAVGTGATAAMHGPEAAAKFRERYELRPYLEELAPYEQAEAQRQERVKALLPLIQLEEQAGIRRELAKEATSQRATEAMRRRLESADLRAERIAARREALEPQDLTGLAPLLGVEGEPGLTALRRVPKSAVPGLLTTLRPRSENTPASIQEYEYAVKQGFKGSLLDYQTKKAEATQRDPQGSWSPLMKDDKLVFFNPTTRELREAPEGVTQQPTADMRNRASAKALLGPAIDALEELSGRVVNKPLSITQKMTAAVRGIDAALANDPDYRVYQDARVSLAGNLAVAQQGSRPSDADIMRVWLPLVPNVYTDTADSAKQKWEMIHKMIGVPSGLPSATSAGGQGEMVQVIRPDGRTSRIPAAQLEEALRRGYRRAE